MYHSFPPMKCYSTCSIRRVLELEIISWILCVFFQSVNIWRLEYAETREYLPFPFITGDTIFTGVIKLPLQVISPCEHDTCLTATWYHSRSPHNDDLLISIYVQPFTFFCFQSKYNIQYGNKGFLAHVCICQNLPLIFLLYKSS